MTTLIIGGTSGLGLELAKLMAKNGDEVIVTGRKDPKEDSLQFESFDLSASSLLTRAQKLASSLPEVNVLVYAAGYFQDGRITDLSQEQIEEMIDVGGRGLIYFVKAVLEKQEKLDELITITSTSQWTPRQKEPVYNFVKAAAGHFSNSIAEDGRVGKVLVAGTAGMKTAFWRETGHDDFENMLEPDWVAAEIQKLRKDNYKYRFARILRQPPRVEIAETRD